MARAKKKFMPATKGGQARKASRIAAGRDPRTGKKVGLRKATRQRVRAAVKARRPNLGVKKVAKRTRMITARKMPRMKSN